MEDDAETVLQNLFRGSGLKGLGGIRECIELPELTIVRPLLSFSRKEIEEYLRSIGQGWRTDESNETDQYARNRIRHNILPEAESVNAQAAAHIHAAAEQLILAEEYLDAREEEVWAECVEPQEDGLRISRKAFLGLHPYMQQRLALRALKEVSGCARDITQTHVRLFTELFTLPTGKSLDMPHRLCALREREAVLLLRKS